MHFETTNRHANLTKLDDGTLVRTESRGGPNAVMADGHIMRLVDLHTGPWSDDNFNLPVN